MYGPVLSFVRSAGPNEAWRRGIVYVVIESVEGRGEPDSRCGCRWNGGRGRRVELPKLRRNKTRRVKRRGLPEGRVEQRVGDTVIEPKSVSGVVRPKAPLSLE